MFTALVRDPKLDPLDTGVIEACLIVLTRSIEVPPAYPWVVEALKAGLFPALFQYGAAREYQDSSDLQDLLTLLPGSLQYYCVLRHIEKGLEDVANSGLLGRLRRIRILSLFFRVANDKLAAKKEFDTLYSSTKFCDNLKACCSSFSCSSSLTHFEVR
jgi:hypothetical protein